MTGKSFLIHELMIFSEIKAKIEDFAIKVLNIGISPGFWLIKKGMIILTYSTSFSCIACKYFKELSFVTNVG